MDVLSEAVFKDWATFQYHEDAMKLQDLIITIIYQSSTAKKMDLGEYLTSTCFLQGSFCI